MDFGTSSARAKACSACSETLEVMLASPVTPPSHARTRMHFEQFWNEFHAELSPVSR
jgi:hypothetical protein